ncbi:MAG: phosphoribulokinase, partial [Shewanella sp.]
KMSLAMELILTPLIKDLMEKRQQLNSPQAN